MSSLRVFPLNFKRFNHVVPAILLIAVFTASLFQVLRTAKVVQITGVSTDVFQMALETPVLPHENAHKNHFNFVVAATRVRTRTKTPTKTSLTKTRTKIRSKSAEKAVPL